MNWQKNNPERVREITLKAVKKHYATNKVEINAKLRERYANDPEFRQRRDAITKKSYNKRKQANS